MKKVIYYQDELNDDFQNTKTSLSVTVDEKYKYENKNVFFKAFSFWLYYFVALPILTIVNLLVFQPKIIGRKNLKTLKGKGYFVYANHTHYSDSWLTQISLAPFKRPYIIANKDAIQIPFIRVLVKGLNTLPVPDTIGGLKNLNRAVEKFVNNKRVIMVYPEAHIWPYYTKARPFKSTSFKFPANTNSACVPVAVCWKKRKFFRNRRKPRAHVYVGKPILPKEDLTKKQNAQYLRDQTFAFIDKTTKEHSTYSYHTYIKTEKIPETAKEQKRAI